MANLLPFLPCQQRNFVAAGINLLRRPHRRAVFHALVGNSSQYVFQRAQNADCIEVVEVPDVRDAEEFALHLTLSVRHHGVVFGAFVDLAVEEPGQLAAARGFQHGTDLNVAVGFLREVPQHHLRSRRLVGGGDGRADVTEQLEPVNGTQRGAVVDAVAAQQGSFSVVDVYDRARKREPSLGLATVYRTLAALNEAGASKYESERENRRHLAKSERKEARGETFQQEREGKSHVGARGRRESSRAMGGKNATRTTTRGRKAARARARTRSSCW